MAYYDILHKYDTAANWTSNNPTLKAGQLGIESDTNYVKIGNGITAWASLSYWSGSGTLVLGETSSTAYRGDRGKTAYDHSQAAHAPSNAEANVQSDWNESTSTADAFILNKPTVAVLGETSTTAYRGDRGKTAYDHSQAAHAPSNAEANVQSDWNESTSTADAFILNKPTVAVLGETSTTAYRGDRGKTAYDHSQTAHAPSDAEANVQSNWTQATSTADSFILNKPTILSLGETTTTAYRGDRGKTAYDHSQAAHAPSNAEANVQSDWTQATSSADSFILNKPTLVTLGETSSTAYRGDRGKTAYDHSQAAHAPSDAEANVQSNWTSATTSADAFILNKPAAATTTVAIPGTTTTIYQWSPQMIRACADAAIRAIVSASAPAALSNRPWIDI